MIKIDKKLNEELTDSEILDIIKKFEESDRHDKYTDNERYFKADHPAIIDQDEPDNDNFPDNRVPIPYARKMSITTKNYMFAKPAQYVAEDQAYIEQLKDVFDINDGFKKTNEIGLDMILHGVGYKLFYTKKYDGRVMPFYAIVEGNEIIPVYDYSIEPELLLAIRYYVKGEDEEAKTTVEVYYPTKINTYEGDGSNISKITIEFKGTKPHGFASVPLVVYGDKKREMGIFDAVKPIIDAIDKITSTDVNEIDKFALAYLVITGQQIDQDTADDVMKKRIFELEHNSTLEYLTKQINSEFNQYLIEFLVSEVHKQTGVPDFASKDFAAESGIALLYKLMGFENIASEIESYFIEGEQKSIFLINSILDRQKTFLDRFMFWKKNPEKAVRVNMERNLPEDVSNKLEIAKKMQEIGISQETILDFVPVIDNVQDEIKRIDVQKQKNFDDFVKNQAVQFGEGEGEDEEEEDQANE